MASPLAPHGMLLLARFNSEWRGMIPDDVRGYLSSLPQGETQFVEWLLCEPTSLAFDLPSVFRTLGFSRLMIPAFEWVDHDGFRVRAAAMLSKRRCVSIVGPVFLCDACSRRIMDRYWPCLSCSFGRLI